MPEKDPFRVGDIVTFHEPSETALPFRVARVRESGRVDIESAYDTITERYTDVGPSELWRMTEISAEVQQAFPRTRDLLPAEPGL